MKAFFDFLYRKADRWDQVIATLQRQLNKLPETSWQPEILRIPKNHKALRAWLENRLWDSQLTYFPEIPLTITTGFQNVLWEKQKEPVIYFIRKRHEIALSFLRNIFPTLPTSPKTIFRFPGNKKTTPKQVVLYFLLDWWTDYGFQKFVSEETIRYKLLLDNESSC